MNAHNHGSGLACPERHVNGTQVGVCVLTAGAAVLAAGAAVLAAAAAKDPQ